MKRMKPEFGDWLVRMLGVNVAVDRLNGDVSGRLFWRVWSGSESFVAMDGDGEPIWPWLDIHRLLEGAGFPVPRIIRVEENRGWALQEDLGDTRLLDVRDDGEYLQLVEAAMDQLLRMQRVLDADRCAASIAGRRSFTPSFFMAELEQTLQYLFYYMLRMPEGELLELQRLMRELTSSLEGGIEVFSHRDYHSANLMAREGGLYMVDWQDARMGPPAYDLASLLRDSYRDIGDTWRELARRFVTSRGDLNMFSVAIAACQRSLKAAGTFARHYRKTGDRSYLDHLPRTFRYLEGYADVCPHLRPLVKAVHDAIDNHVGEVDLTGWRTGDHPLLEGEERETGGEREEEALGADTDG